MAKSFIAHGIKFFSVCLLSLSSIPEIYAMNDESSTDSGSSHHLQQRPQGRRVTGAEINSAFRVARDTEDPATRGTSQHQPLLLGAMQTYLLSHPNALPQDFVESCIEQAQDKNNEAP